MNVDQSPERASTSLDALEIMPVKNKNITAQECEQDARLAPQGGWRNSTDTLNSGGSKEESGDRSMLSLTSANLSPREPPSVPRILTWPSFWTANGGIILVIVAMFFGAIMTLTTRLLELERKDDKRMQPIQVGQSILSTKKLRNLT